MYKTIHIGKAILRRMEDHGFTAGRIAERLKIPEEKVIELLEGNEMPTQLLLRFSKLLEYDFFRLYSMHLILYSPPKMGFSQLNRRHVKSIDPKKKEMPSFQKNTYTVEIIRFVLKKIENGEVSMSDAINKYNIPKTTLYRWRKKYTI